ncbi:hypothetical protein GCM10022237_09050 [Nocardioides ginsengisoli]|uniref:Recombinase family protein n=1 Tax=Nocardioides ginsengisoli TaxID=363868 RepID=A0ABW3VZV1_9ACTN
MRVVGYARLSRASEDSTSIEKQHEILTKTAEARGWTLVGIETDGDVSATKSRLDRPGLTAARDAVASGLADALLCWRLDRVARSVVDMGTLLDEGLQIVSATEPLDTTTPMGRAMVEVLQVFAALESRTTGERARATKAFLKSRRRWGGGPRPYGYTPVPAEDGVGKVLVVNEAERAVVRRIFEALDSGASVNGLARALNADGVSTPTSRGTWLPASVLNLARALHVSGYLTEAARLDERGRPVGRERRPVLDEDGEPVRPWEPLLADDLAERVRARVTREALDEARSAATKAGREGANRRLLSGLAYCPCGERLLVRSRRGGTFYGCRGLAEGSHVLADAEKVDEVAERLFLGSFSGTAVVETVATVSVSDEVAEIDRHLAAATGEITRTSTADLPVLFARIADLTAEKERLEASSAKVTTRTTTTPYGEAWDGWTVAERREHLSALGVRVDVRPARQRGAWDDSRVVLDVPGADYLAGQLD